MTGNRRGQKHSLFGLVPLPRFMCAIFLIACYGSVFEAWLIEQHQPRMTNNERTVSCTAAVHVINFASKEEKESRSRYSAPTQTKTPPMSWQEESSRNRMCYLDLSRGNCHLRMQQAAFMLFLGHDLAMPQSCQQCHQVHLTKSQYIAIVPAGALVHHQIVLANRLNRLSNRLNRLNRLMGTVRNSVSESPMVRNVAFKSCIVDSHRFST